MKDYYHILITRKKIDSEYKKYNICSLKEVEGYYKNYIIGKKILIDSDKIKHCDISSFTVMKSSKKIENKNISFNTDDDIKNCTEEIKQNIELNIFETLLKFFYENKGLSITVIVFVMLSLSNIILPFFMVNITDKQYEFFGVIGDSSGLLGTILSGLAFLLLIYTATLQKNELSLQRKELEATRTELENQKKEFQIQNQTLKRQQFENTFFNMLKTQENIISSLNIETIGDIEDIPKNVKSKKVFEHIFKDRFQNKPNNDCFNLNNIKLDDIARENYESIQCSLKNNTSDLISNNNSECICKKVEKFYKFGDYDLSNYFIFIYRIIKFVDDTNFSEFIYFSKEELKNETKKIDRIHKEKSEYVDIVRATLSTYEIFMLFFNGLTQNKMKNLIITYHLFNNINYDLLGDLCKLYVIIDDNNKKDSAYGDNLKNIEHNF